MQTKTTFPIKTVRQRQIMNTQMTTSGLPSKNSRQNFFTSVRLDNKSKTKKEGYELANEKFLQQGNKKIQK